MKAKNNWNSSVETMAKNTQRPLNDPVYRRMYQTVFSESPEGPAAPWNFEQALEQYEESLDDPWQPKEALEFPTSTGRSSHPIPSVEKKNDAKKVNKSSRTQEYSQEYLQGERRRRRTILRAVAAILFAVVVSAGMVRFSKAQTQFPNEDNSKVPGISGHWFVQASASRRPITTQETRRQRQKALALDSNPLDSRPKVRVESCGQRVRPPVILTTSSLSHSFVLKEFPLCDECMPLAEESIKSAIPSVYPELEELLNSSDTLTL